MPSVGRMADEPFSALEGTVSFGTLRDQPCRAVLATAADPERLPMQSPVTVALRRGLQVGAPWSGTIRIGPDRLSIHQSAGWAFAGDAPETRDGGAPVYTGAIHNQFAAVVGRFELRPCAPRGDAMEWLGRLGADTEAEAERWRQAELEDTATVVKAGVPLDLFPRARYTLLGCWRRAGDRNVGRVSADSVGRIVTFLDKPQRAYNTKVSALRSFLFARGGPPRPFACPASLPPPPPPHGQKLHSGFPPRQVDAHGSADARSSTDACLS